MRRRQLIGFSLVLAIGLGVAVRLRHAPPAPVAADGGVAPARWESDAGSPRSDGGATLSGARGHGTIAGDVFDGRGWPIAGASLRVQLLDGSQSFAGGAANRLEPGGELGVLAGPIPFPPRTPLPRPSLAAVLSDEQGRFHIGELPAGRMVVLASHPDFADGRSDELLLAEAGQGRVRIALAAGRTVAVRVVDERGPIAGAEVWRAGELAGLTDGAGRYSLTRLATLPVEIEARARGYVAQKKTLDPATESALDLLLARAGGRVTGVVVDERGYPVVAAHVVVEGGARIEVLTDHRGEFLLEGAPDGTLALRVTHDDHPAATARVDAGGDARIVMVPGGGVDGDVRDERTGAALPSARVTLDGAGESRSAPADKRGRFRLLGCPAGKATLTWKAPGYLAGSRVVEVPPADATREVTLRDLRLELSLGGSISGLVRDDRGGVVPGLEVVAGSARGRTDAGGHFKLGPVATGRIEVRAGSASETVTVDAGRTTMLELRIK